MTETVEREAVGEVLQMIDDRLKHMRGRDVMSADEVSDILLDIRVVLSAENGPAPATLAPTS